MQITVLAVPDCPNARVAAGRITAALAGRPASVELVEVTGEAEAARLGMTGSPTILLDGVDPFAAAGAVPSVSCRIYRGPAGAADGAPSVQDLTAALSAAGLPGTAGDEGCEADTPAGRTGQVSASKSPRTQPMYRFAECRTTALASRSTVPPFRVYRRS